MRFYVFVIAAFVGACSSTGSQGQKELANLTSEIEKLSKELEAGKADLQKAIAEHDAIVNNTDGNFVSHYKAFGKGIETVEEDREDIRARIQKVKDAAAPYFARWSDDNAKLTDPGLRDRDKKNMEETKARYDEIYKAGDEAKNAYEPLMATLKQHHQFWSNSLNANTAAQLKGDTEKIDKSANSLYALIDKVVSTAKKYNESVAMRVAPPPPAPAEPAKK
jgi:chromosome segregation ATPase